MAGNWKVLFILVVGFGLAFVETRSSGRASLGVVEVAVVALLRRGGQGAVAVEHDVCLVVLLEKVQFQRVAVFGGVVAVLAAELIHVGVALHVAVEHGLVDAAVVALGTLVGLGADVHPDVVLQMVLQLRHELAMGTLKKLLWLDVLLQMQPKLHLVLVLFDGV